jgi:hypothetical protein
VTLAVLLRGKCGRSKAACYVAAQLLGRETLVIPGMARGIWKITIFGRGSFHSYVSLPEGRSTISMGHGFNSYVTNYQKVTCNINVEKSTRHEDHLGKPWGFYFFVYPVPTSYFGRFDSLKRKQYQNSMLIKKAGVRVYSSQEHDGTCVLNIEQHIYGEVRWVGGQNLRALPGSLGPAGTLDFQ